MRVTPFRVVALSMTCVLFVIARPLSIDHVVRRSPLQRLVLNGNQTHQCYNEPTYKGQEECLQPLLEKFYGHEFTYLCPSFAIHIVRLKCSECPWDSINTSMLNYTSDSIRFAQQQIRAWNKSCAMAKSALKYTNYYNMRWRIYSCGSIGSMILFIATAYFSVTPIEPETGNSRNGGRIFGITFSEPVFLSVLWYTYGVGIALLFISGKHATHCLSDMDTMFQEIVRVTANVVLLSTSLSRCFELVAVGFPRDVESWKTYLKDSSPKTRKRFLSYAFRFVGPGLFCVLFVWEMFYVSILGFTNGLNNSPFGDASTSACNLELNIRNQVVIPAIKFCIELCVVYFYAFGPSKVRFRFYRRYIVLMTAVPVYVTLFALEYIITNKTLLDNDYMVYTLPFMSLAHVVSVSLMGLLEPVRIGWPPQSNNVEDKGGTIDTERGTGGEPNTFDWEKWSENNRRGKQS